MPPKTLFLLPQFRSPGRCIDTYTKVDLRTVSFDVPPQGTLIAVLRMPTLHHHLSPFSFFLLLLLHSLALSLNPTEVSQLLPEDKN